MARYDLLPRATAEAGENNMDSVAMRINRGSAGESQLQGGVQCQHQTFRSKEIMATAIIV